MDWQRPTPYQLPDSPTTEANLPGTFESYRQALAMMGSQPDGMERLFALLGEVSAKIESESRSLLSQTLSDYTRNQDQLVFRSTTKVAPSPDRSAPRTEPSRQPSALDLLSSSRRLGPRLAQKLVLSAARREARR